MLHRRIVMIGATGSSKSTLAHRPARSLDVAYVELDASETIRFRVPREAERWLRSTGG
jgi:shikimate kinase